MDAFWSWQGWTAVGSIACVLALATLVFAFREVWKQRRQMPLFNLDWALVATAMHKGDPYHVVEFRNNGRGSGDLLGLTLCGARAQLDDEFYAPAFIASGQTFRLLVTTADMGGAWVRYLYRTPDDATRFRIHWAPLHTTGAMADEWNRQVDAWNARLWIEKRWRRVFPKYAPVAPVPTGIPWHVVPRRKHAGPLKVLMNGPSGAVYNSAMLGDNVPTLPYVPLKP